MERSSHNIRVGKEQQESAEQKFSDFEVGSVMNDSQLSEGIERLMLSEPSQKPESMKNSSRQHLEMLVAVLQQYTQEEIQEIFTLFQDPKQSGKIILTEAQFNLVKKIYPKCFNDNKFSLNDNQLITQFFMNLKALYMKINKPIKGRKELHQ